MEEFVGLGAARQPQSPLVRDFAQGLAQDQAGLGGDRVDPPAAGLAREDREVLVGQISPQAQPEPPLAGRRPVAGTHVAAAWLNAGITSRRKLTGDGLLHPLDLDGRARPRGCRGGRRSSPSRSPWERPAPWARPGRSRGSGSPTRPHGSGPGPSRQRLGTDAIELSGRAPADQRGMSRARSRVAVVRSAGASGRLSGAGAVDREHRGCDQRSRSRSVA